MTFFVCKMCGRSLRAEESPNFCYFDRSDLIENISDEDAVKMGLFSYLTKEKKISQPSDEAWHVLNQHATIYEFGRDVKYNPYTGEPLPFGFGGNQTIGSMMTLSEWQDGIMEMVT